MNLVPTRPVTIYKADNSVVINPHLLRHPNGSLFLWIEDGHDSHFTPVFRMRSTDNGQTWVKEGQNAPGDFGFSETSLVHLKDGRLYGVMRTDIDSTGHVLHHVWSSDGGKLWTKPERLRIVDEKVQPPQQLNWPRVRVLVDGTLVLTYGRPGKHMLFDPSGTGKQWRGHLDLHAWELETQEFMGVPAELRLHGDTARCIRYWDSMDYLALEVIGPRELLVCYDVQTYYENWNAKPYSGIRMVRVKVED